MKAIITSHCQDSWFDSVGAKKLLNSFRFFHPGVEIKISGDHDLQLINEKYTWATWYTYDPLVAEQYLGDYDLIVHIDADSIVTGPLDELFHQDFEIAGVRNNNDFGYTTNQWGCVCSPVRAGRNVALDSLNAGLIASRSAQFWEEFKLRNEALGDTGPNRGNYGEQDVWNEIFWSGRYRAVVLDAIDQPVYYGVSQQVCTPGAPVQTAWRDLYMYKGELFSREKKVKIIHHASGHIVPKLDYRDWVSPQVMEFLDTITADLRTSR